MEARARALGGRLLAFAGVAAALVAVAGPAAAVPVDEGRVGGAIEDPSGTALVPFFEALAQTAARRPGAVTRIAHYGDSLIVPDLITKTLRRLYQERYGDAGPGFVLAGRPWPWYRRQGVDHGASTAWTTHRVLKGGLRDGTYGYGGVSFDARPGRSTVWFRTTEDEGRPVMVSRADVHYLVQPGGGDFEILIDGEHIVTIATDGARRQSAFHELRFPDGQHGVELRATGGGPVRLFGVALEREGPGVVYDSLGINGAVATSLGLVAAEHLAEQLGHRRPNLVVLMFGANETNRPALVNRYAESLVPVLRRIREAAPGSSCLVMAPMDRGERRASGRYRTNPYVPRIVDGQRAAAFEVGCAFYDTYSAMGGELSMVRWMRRGLASSDLTHPSPEGGAVLAEGLFRALEAARTSSLR